MPIPANAIVFSRASSMILTRPLSGSGILVHRGNLRLPAGSKFSGLLYVDGALHVSAPAEIRGTVIVTGRVTSGGSPGLATLRYDPDVLSSLRLMFGRYRLAGPLRVTVPAE